MRARWAAVPALIAALLLAALGVWQIERRQDKHALIARVAARMAAAPVDVTAHWRDDPYTRVVVTGRWRAVRPAYTQAATALGGGFWVLSPVDTARGPVLINRGFVPAEMRGEVAAPVGAVRLTGLLRASEPGGGFLRSNDPAADRWHSRDVVAIAATRGLAGAAPFFVDADVTPGPTWPRGGMTVVRFPDNHLVYALTWFALAGLAAWFAWRIASGTRSA